MYANLKVTVSDSKSTKEYLCWQVDVGPHGSATLYLDGNDTNEGDYLIEKGTVNVLGKSIGIVANF